jgi:hypothetical protein
MRALAPADERADCADHRPHQAGIELRIEHNQQGEQKQIEAPLERSGHIRAALPSGSR